jgi:CheY-like chemotaxis protein
MALVTVRCVGVPLTRGIIGPALPQGSQLKIWSARSGELGLRMVRATSPDIVLVGSLTTTVARDLLHAGKRGLDGAEFCRHLRADTRPSHLPS